MKKYLFCILAMFSVALLAGCDEKVGEKEEEVSLILNGESSAYMDVCFYLRNTYRNPLDPEFESDILEGVTVEYGGETYRIDELTPQYRLRMESSYPDYSKKILKFGKFSDKLTSGGYHGEIFTINWGDGTSDEVAFDSNISYDSEGIGGKIMVEKQGVEIEAKLEQKIWLNGELQSEYGLGVVIEKDDGKIPGPGEDGWIWDFASYDICLFVENADGDNLLDPDFEDNILASRITVSIQDGNTYELRGNSEVGKTRAYLAPWYGFRVASYSYQDDTPVLKLGEFSPYGYKDKILTINWGDGTSKEVAFDLYITWAWNPELKRNDPTVHKNIRLNDGPESEDSLTLTIVK